MVSKRLTTTGLILIFLGTTLLSTIWTISCFVCRTADVDGDDGIGLAEAIYGLQLLSGLRE